MAQDFATRLRMLLAHRGLKQKDLAAEIRAEPNTVNGWVNGRRKPDGPTIYAVAHALRADYKWLEAGEGLAPWDRAQPQPEASLADVVQVAVIKAIEEARAQGVSEKDVTAEELKEKPRPNQGKASQKGRRSQKQGRRKFG